MTGKTCPFEYYNNPGMCHGIAKPDGTVKSPGFSSKIILGVCEMLD